MPFSRVTTRRVLITQLRLSSSIVKPSSPGSKRIPQIRPVQRVILPEHKPTQKPSRARRWRQAVLRIPKGLFLDLQDGFRRLPQFVRMTLIFFFLFLPPVVVFRNHFYNIVRVRGPSMSPYINTDYQDPTRDIHDITKGSDRILLDLRKPCADLRRGMVVAFRTPHDPEKWAIKRIVALQGDRVLPLPHYPGHDSLNGEGLIIPWGHIWVEGDVPDSVKKDTSLDSNVYGPISAGLVVGKALKVIPPFLIGHWISIDATHFKLPARIQTNAVTLPHPDGVYEAPEDDVISLQKP